ncbi:hypothetical protein [Salinispora cortesiana]|uniref:hypothetical protein n=1 Tax=Salinispora cortesiana TaxID=1305843 RepID=UPI0003FCEF66|nr:hypothetical protein [Salinispora cortesiana]
MTPHHLHATAAAWSLNAALAQLEARATAEARAIAAEQAAAVEPISSPTWGRRHALGGHGDPTSDAILTATAGPLRRNRYAETQTGIISQLDAVARHLPGHGVADPLQRIRQHIPAMQPGTAAALTALLRKLDGRARRVLRVGPDRDPLRGVACPACHCRHMHVQTSGPQYAWTVVCSAGCRCVGQGCGCGMPGAVEGVAHIWPRVAVLKPGRVAP